MKVFMPQTETPTASRLALKQSLTAGNMGVPSGEGTEGEGRLGKQSKRKQQTIHTAQTPWQRLPEAYMVGEPSLCPSQLCVYWFL